MVAVTADNLGAILTAHSLAARNPATRKEGKHELSLFAATCRPLFGACAPAAPLAVGYVEGDYVLLAPIEVAQVETVAVQTRRPCGARHADGDAGKRRRQDRRRAGRSGARAGRRRSLRTCKIGKRPEEIAVLKAQVDIGARRRPPTPERSADRASRPVQARHRHAGRLRHGLRHAGDRQCAGRPGGGQSRRRRPAGARRDDQGRREPGQAGAGGARAGAMAAVQARAGGALARPRRRRHPQSRRHRRAVRAGHLDAAGRRGEAQASTCRRARSRPVKVGTLLGVHCDGCGPDADGARQLCLARPGVHAAGDLFAREPAEAGLPRRGAAGGAMPARCSPGRSSTSIWRMAAR